MDERILDGLYPGVHTINWLFMALTNKIVSPIVANYPIFFCEKWYIYPNSG